MVYYCYPPDDGGATKTVTFVIPLEGGEPGQLVVSLGNRVSLLNWPPSQSDDEHTASPTATLHVTTDDHFNDAKCDPQGRLWAGRYSTVFALLPIFVTSYS